MSSEPTPQAGPATGMRGEPGAAGPGAGRGYDPDDRQARPASPVGQDDGDAGPAVSAGGAVEPEEARVLTDPKAMRALAHPVRVDLLQLFSVHATLTATQASELLGESPANCAFHLRTLAKYGFLKEAGGGRGRERPWARVDRSLTVTMRQDDPQAAVAADALSRVMFERWVERARQVLGTGALIPGWEDAFGWSRSAVYLTAAETVELRTEMRQLLRRYQFRTDPAHRPDDARPVEWTLFTAPASGPGFPGDDSAEPAGQRG